MLEGLEFNSIILVRDYFFLKNYVTSEGFASHDVLHYNNLWAIVKLCGCWQVLWCFLWSKGRIVCGCLSWLIAHSIVYIILKDLSYFTYHWEDLGFCQGSSLNQVAIRLVFCFRILVGVHHELQEIFVFLSKEKEINFIIFIPAFFTGFLQKKNTW